uniref:Uncharacterized protein n=1 Tax=Anguilla anguilla TaxID=7936 RepID=A0A0E9WKI5_ANGAN
MSTLLVQRGGATPHSPLNHSLSIFNGCTSTKCQLSVTPARPVSPHRPPPTLLLHRDAVHSPRFAPQSLPVIAK